VITTLFRFLQGPVKKLERGGVGFVRFRGAAPAAPPLSIPRKSRAITGLQVVVVVVKIFMARPYALASLGRCQPMKIGKFLVGARWNQKEDLASSSLTSFLQNSGRQFLTNSLWGVVGARKKIWPDPDTGTRNKDFASPNSLSFSLSCLFLEVSALCDCLDPWTVWTSFLQSPGHAPPKRVWSIRWVSRWETAPKKVSFSPSPGACPPLCFFYFGKFQVGIHHNFAEPVWYQTGFGFHSPILFTGLEGAAPQAPPP